MNQNIKNTFFGLIVLLTMSGRSELLLAEAEIPQLPEQYAAPTPVPSLPPEVESTPPPTEPTPGNTPLPTATPGGECPYYEARLINDYDSSGQYNSNPVDFSDNAASSACLTNIVDSAIQQCYESETIGGTLSAWWDDCVANRIYSLIDPNQSHHRQTSDSQDTNGDGYAGQISTRTFFFDAECRIWTGDVYSGDPYRYCSGLTVDYYSSPISLIWDESTKFDQEITFVNFQLDPRLEGRTYSWKASAAFPLLVIDPTRSGKITHASQLFGEWAFGGKEGLSNVSWSTNPEQMKSGTPWRDGYEALASLDSNKDNQISADEMKGLSLWFDYNKDGVSQNGEVKTVESVGLTKLFYRANRRDPATGSIYADRGFERVINGIATQGRSVDWYGEAGLTQADLIRKQMFKSSIESDKSNESEPLAQMKPGKFSDEGTSVRKVGYESTGALPVSTKVEEKVATREYPTNYQEVSKELTGIWKWTMQGSGSQSSGAQISDSDTAGILIFKLGKAGLLVGASLVEQNLKQGSGGTPSKAISTFQFHNLKATPEGEKISLSWDVVTEAGLSTTNAELDLNTMILSGVTEADLRTKKGTGYKFSYKWSAKKGDLSRS